MQPVAPQSNEMLVEIEEGVEEEADHVSEMSEVENEEGEVYGEGDPRKYDDMQQEIC